MVLQVLRVATGVVLSHNPTGLLEDSMPLIGADGDDRGGFILHSHTQSFILRKLGAF